MAPISSAKLTYFDGRGRGEICRWTLAHAGVEFEDYRVKDGEWSAIKLSKSCNYCEEQLSNRFFKMFSGA